MKKLFFPLITLLISFSLQGESAALDINPFNTFNQSPIIQIYGLPAIGNSKVVDRGRTMVEFGFDVANDYTNIERNGELLILDGETYRTRLIVRRGITDKIELGLELPYLSHSGGFLDPFIETWHSIFGLPQGGRKQTSQDNLNYSYSRNGTDLIKITRSTSGIGDIRFSAAYQIYNNNESHPDRTVALRSSVKLPTGDSSRLTGSGAADIAFYFSAHDQYKMENNSLDFFGGAGLLLLGKGDVMPEQQRGSVLFGTIGVAWNRWQPLILKLQLDTHTPFYEDSSLNQLDGNAAQLVLGGSYSLTKETALELALVEDIVVPTSPDVSFHISLHTGF